MRFTSAGVLFIVSASTLFLGRSSKPIKPDTRSTDQARKGLYSITPLALTKAEWHVVSSLTSDT